MKKRKIELSKKLLLNKKTVGQLNADQQSMIAGGADTWILGCTADTQEISVCRATRPVHGGPCCFIP
ncbi:class I lanthipeptide [Chitinophaga solisilvae]|uniref:Uncharacterized protein n=1 Tax=Chitinophaga solisilvae TaxID=1233460 RepID=A0A433WLA4_9BACT|nr:class I lanthipeptide [Chitinophaga solisilvae]NSL90924.1 hypothetical protein [Chitinophaga solisilvae]